MQGWCGSTPRAPDPSGIESEGWSGVGATEDGGFNWDAGAVANLPVADGAALRLVGYGGEDSGYIDDRARQIEDINTGSHYGGRAALAVALGSDWDMTVSAFGQHTETRDGQYTDGRFDGLERESLVAQPFRERIYGGAVTVTGALGTLELSSITGMVDHALRSVFDSSILRGATAAARYVGRSFLDLDQMDRVEQGDFGSFDAALWWNEKHWGLRLEAFNLTNTRGNRFAFGNPFTARIEDQQTPLRPLTVRLQVSFRR